MPITSRVCEIENSFWRALSACAERTDCGRAADECDEFASRHNFLPMSDRSEKLSTYQRAVGPVDSAPGCHLHELPESESAALRLPKQREHEARFIRRTAHRIHLS